MSAPEEELSEQLAYVQHRIRWIEGELRGDEIPLGIPEAELKDDLRNLQDEERRLIALLTAIEDCDHSEVEDTGGPDGSQVCLKCGRIGKTNDGLLVVELRRHAPIRVFGISHPSRGPDTPAILRRFVF